MNKKISIFLLIAVLAVLIIPSITNAAWWNPFSWGLWKVFQGKTTPDISDAGNGWKLYKNKDYGFEISFPSDIYVGYKACKPASDPKFVTTCSDVTLNSATGGTSPSLTIQVYEPKNGNYSNFAIGEDCKINKGYPGSNYYADLSSKSQESYTIGGKGGSLIYCYTDQTKTKQNIQFISSEINSKYKIVVRIGSLKNGESDKYQEIIKQVVSSVKFK